MFFQNLLLTGFFAAAWFVLPQPQVIVGGLLFAALAMVTLLPGQRVYGDAHQASSP
jgi:hypothetical protein